MTDHDLDTLPSGSGDDLNGERERDKTLSLDQLHAHQLEVRMRSALDAMQHLVPEWPRGLRARTVQVLMAALSPLIAEWIDAERQLLLKFEQDAAAESAE